MPLRTQSRSPYMEFSKLRTGAKFNLAASGVMSYPWRSCRCGSKTWKSTVPTYTAICRC